MEAAAHHGLALDLSSLFFLHSTQSPAGEKLLRDRLWEQL